MVKSKKKKKKQPKNNHNILRLFCIIFKKYFRKTFPVVTETLKLNASQQTFCRVNIWSGGWARERERGGVRVLT